MFQVGTDLINLISFNKYLKQTNNFSGEIGFLNVHTMITLGFAFVMAFLKKYGYGSIGFTLLLVAYTLQWSLLVEWIFKQTLDATFTNWILVVNPLK